MEVVQSSNPPAPQDRRSFLVGAASGAFLTAGLGAVGLKMFWPSAPASGAQKAEPDVQAGAAHNPPQGLFDRDRFAQYVNTKFDVQTGKGSPVELELLEVAPVKSQRVGSKQYESFSLIFSGPKSQVLEQKIYLLSHKSMGNIELFLSSVGKPKDANVVKYQTVFDRLM